MNPTNNRDVIRNQNIPIGILRRIATIFFIMPQIRWILLLTLGFAILTSFSASAQDEPLTAVVINETFLWSGPGNHYYPTTLLHVGDRLDVYFTVKETWCAVRPPKGCFTWVDARNVELGEKQIGTVLVNGVQARVGSDLSNQCGAVQVTLERGEKVFVLERIETPGDAKTPVWYKIAPPAGEFRFISRSDLQWDVVPKNASSAAQNNNPQNSEVNTSHQPQTLRERQPIQLASDLQPRVSQENTPEEFNADDFHTALEQLKLDFAEKIMEQEVAADSLQSLSHIARMLYQSAPTQTDKNEVYRLLAGLERATRIRRNETQNQNETEIKIDANHFAKKQTEINKDDPLISAVSPSRLPTPQRDVVAIESQTNKKNNDKKTIVAKNVNSDGASDIYEQTIRQPIQKPVVENDFTERAVFPNAAETTQVLLYDTNTGAYQEIPPQEWGRYLTAEQTPTYQQQYPYQSYPHEPPKQSWIQRFISGKLFQSGNPNTPNKNAAYGGVMNDHNFIPDRYSTENRGVYENDNRNVIDAANAFAKKSPRKGFYNSQPMIIASSQQNHFAANSYKRSRPIQNSYSYNNADMLTGVSLIGKTEQSIRSNIPQEIVLPEGVEVPGEVVIYDESQGINLTPQMISGLQTTDQATALMQIIQSHGATAQETTSVAPETSTVLQSQQPILLQQTASRQPTEQTASPWKNSLASGRRENGGNVVSAGAFDAIGRLGRIKVNQNKPNDVPKYALVNDAGKIIFLVSQTVGIDLNHYVNQTVGLIGVKSSYVQDGKTYPYISAKAVYPIQGRK
ncbi:MAG: hypothetical protein LBT05_01580 [Planctomycetaceae bacterium]|jgi:hypothetical protein|nr:hypothetical protein [Planctomycetaceae bacterium]